MFIIDFLTADVKKLLSNTKITFSQGGCNRKYLSMTPSLYISHTRSHPEGGGGGGG